MQAQAPTPTPWVDATRRAARECMRRWQLERYDGSMRSSAREMLQLLSPSSPPSPIDVAALWDAWLRERGVAVDDDGVRVRVRGAGANGVFLRLTEEKRNQPDLDAAFLEARRTDRPCVVVFRAQRVREDRHDVCVVRTDGTVEGKCGFWRDGNEWVLSRQLNS